jgi:hypothetical protein
LTAVVSSDSIILRPRVEVFDPTGNSLGSDIASRAGESVYVQAAPVSSAGTYRVQISGASTTSGDFAIRLYLNTTVEQEGGEIGENSTVATNAQSLDASWLAVNPGSASVQRATVLGKLDTPIDGGYAASSIPSNFVDISATGTRTTITATTAFGAQTLSPTDLSGFSFPFYGTTYNTLSFSLSGLLSFGAQETTTSNNDLSSAFPQSPVIAALWNMYTFDHSGTGSASKTVFWQVLGSGADQHLIVQWNQATITFGGGLVTFQAILRADGSIELNYASNVTSVNVSGATVGIKSVYTSFVDTPRLLVHFDQSATDLVGPNLSTRIHPVAATADFYRVSLNAGDRVSLAIHNLDAGNVDIHLLGTDLATVIASGTPGPTNFQESFANYLVLTTGVYGLRVNGDIDLPYSIVVGRNAGLDLEENDSLATAQVTLNPANMLGSIGAIGDSADWYVLSAVEAGQQIVVESSTPSGGPNLFLNSFDPHLEVYRPDGVLLTSGVDLADGRNERIHVLAAPVAGDYFVRLTADGLSQGEYSLFATKLAAPTVVDRRVFYNRATSSVFGDGAGNPANSIDTSKEALLPGQTTGADNYTNYVHGLNGIVVDVANLLNTASPSDFQFATWDGIDGAGFVAATATPTITTLPQAGLNGSARIKIEFENRAVYNTWLRVTVLANANTGLITNDIFYFGSAIGDFNVGNIGTPTIVRTNATDTSRVRQNQSPSANSVSVTNLYDLNKDGRVNATDTSLVRQNVDSAIIAFFDA